jgi:ElaB/YqjD/DUF883 family membrane-anchored ribosome-binding protein
MELKEQLESAVNLGSGAHNAKENPQELGLSAERKVSNAIGSPSFERIASTAHHAVEQLTHVASESAHSLALKRQQMAETGHEVVNNFRHYIQEKPGTSIGIALAAGFLIRHFLRFR